jgi:hypothetical protein
VEKSGWSLMKKGRRGTLTQAAMLSALTWQQLLLAGKSGGGGCKQQETGAKSVRSFVRRMRRGGCNGRSGNNTGIGVVLRWMTVGGGARKVGHHRPRSPVIDSSSGCCISIWSSGREKKGEEELIIKREKCPNNVPKGRVVLK